MKRYATIFGLLLCLLWVNVKAEAQNSRWDYIALTTAGSGDAVPLLAIPGAGVSFYTCSGGSCTTLANTYNSASSGTPCPTTAQVVLSTSSTCVSTADSQGNFGAWFQTGQYAYSLTIQGTTYGPYPFTIGGGGSGGSGTVGSGTTGQIAQYAADGTTVGGATVSGDGSLAVGGAFTLASVNSNTGTCGDSTHVGEVTLNVKGLATACVPVAISFPSGGPTLQTNGADNSSQALLNIQSGPGISVTNPSGGDVFITNTGSSAVLQTDGVNNTSQSLLNFTVTANTGVALTNPSGGIENAAGVVMGASGSSHAQGMVPDPGATAGTTRFLREDGSFAVPSATALSYPSGQTNQVWQYTSPSTLAGGGFLPAIDIADCTTAYLYNEGSGTVADNLCATGSANDGTIIGSPTWTQYGLALNPSLPSGGQAVQLPAVSAADKTFEFALYLPTWGTQYGVNWGTNSDTFSSNNSILCGSTNTIICLISGSRTQGSNGALATSLQVLYPSGGAATNTSEPLPTGWHVLTMVCGTIATNVDTYYLDGAPFSMLAPRAGFSQNESCPTTPTGIYGIGGSSLASQTWGHFILAASITYPAVRTAAQIAYDSAALATYMASRGGGQKANQFASAAQFAWSGAVPYVACVGDSRMYSVIGPSPCSYMTLDDTTAIYGDYGVPGQKAYDLAADVLGPFNDIPSGAPRAIDLIWININDIIASNGTVVPNGLAQSDRSAIRNAKATGATVLFATEISATGADTDKDLIDPVILQYAKQWGADGVINLNSFPVLGADGAYASATYFSSDHIHPTVLSNSTIIGIAFQNAINEAWGSTPLQHNSTSATTYQELAQDDYLNLTGSAAQTITLPDCQGYTHDRYLYNLSAYPATVVPASSGFGASFTQYINGASSFMLSAGSSVDLAVAPGPPSTGTCTWIIQSGGGASIVHSLGWGFGDAATSPPLTTSEVGYITVPFACTITGWHIMANTGTVTIKTARVATGGTALPTLASNSISTSGVSLSTGTLINSTTVSDFTSTTISAGDTLGFFVTAVSSASQVTFQLDCAQ